MTGWQQPRGVSAPAPSGVGVWLGGRRSSVVADPKPRWQQRRIWWSSARAPAQAFRSVPIGVTRSLRTRDRAGNGVIPAKRRSRHRAGVSVGAQRCHPVVADPGSRWQRRGPGEATPAPSGAGVSAGAHRCFPVDADPDSRWQRPRFRSSDARATAQALRSVPIDAGRSMPIRSRAGNSAALVKRRSHSRVQALWSALVGATRSMPTRGHAGNGVDLAKRRRRIGASVSVGARRCYPVDAYPGPCWQRRGPGEAALVLPRKRFGRCPGATGIQLGLRGWFEPSGSDPVPGPRRSGRRLATTSGG